MVVHVYCMIDLIVINPHEGTAFQQTDEAQVGGNWQHESLEGVGVAGLYRQKGGQEGSGTCSSTRGRAECISHRDGLEEHMQWLHFIKPKWCQA